jgi:uncharacterized damage-inducible protein DinB
MRPNDPIVSGLELSSFVMGKVTDDLTDDDLLVRPTAGANHAAWILGHVISAEQRIVGGCGAKMPALPDGFAERYTKETSGVDDAGRFDTLQTYRALLAAQQAATLEFARAADENLLNQPGPESIRQFAPTVAVALTLAANHRSFHAGQFAAVRRKLGKPVAF